MAQSKFLTLSDAQTIGWELARKTPDNQLDIWQRLCYQLEQALPHTSECVSRLSAINDTLFRLRRYPCPYLELMVPVMPEEAKRLIMPGIRLDFENLARLQSLLYETADQLGSHPAAIPLYPLWDTLDRVRYDLTGDSPFGKRGEEPEIEGASW